MESPKFQYWLSLFAKIMPHVEILFKQMQSRVVNSVVTTNYITDFEFQIQKSEIISELMRTQTLLPPNINKDNQALLILKLKMCVMWC